MFIFVILIMFAKNKIIHRNIIRFYVQGKNIFILTVFLSNSIILLYNIDKYLKVKV